MPSQHIQLGKKALKVMVMFHFFCWSSPFPFRLVVRPLGCLLGDVGCNCTFTEWRDGVTVVFPVIDCGHL